MLNRWQDNKTDITISSQQVSLSAATGTQAVLALRALKWVVQIPMPASHNQAGGST